MSNGQPSRLTHFKRKAIIARSVHGWMVILNAVRPRDSESRHVAPRFRLSHVWQTLCLVACLKKSDNNLSMNFNVA